MDSSSNSADNEVDMDKENVYEHLGTLGVGAYGRVDATKDKKTGILYAMKTMELEGLEVSGIPSNAIREVSILKELDHPNIVKIEKVLYNRPQIHLIMEYMDTDLKKYIQEHKPLKAGKVQSIMKQILEGIKEIHSSRIIHRDLKPENIFIDEKGDVKIGDFGISRTFGVSNKPMTPDVVTIFYRAPEIVLGISEYSIPIDIWSIGCIFAELYNGSPLFEVETEIDLINKIFKRCGTPTEDTWPGITSKLSIVMPNFPQKPVKIEGMDELAIDLLNQMLSLNPEVRITAKEALQHAFFSAEYE